MLLVAAAGVSFFVEDEVGAILILTIVVLSGLLSFHQEFRAGRAVDDLLARVTTRATVLRDGAPVEVAQADVVIGDVCLLAAGDAVPGDARVLEARDLYVDEAALTGEPFAAAKRAGTCPADAPLARRDVLVHFGTHVVTGAGRAVIVRCGDDTELGRISATLRARAPETDFERGVRRFGHLLLEITLMLVLCIFAVNVALDRPVLDSLLFAVALAVGLTPQLLPAVISVNLAHGARRMAERRVIVKRLAAIESFGSMDVLCSDKTGTLTVGVVEVDGGYAPDGPASDAALDAACLNAAFEAGFANPIDHALRALGRRTGGARKIDEVPFDFQRKRLTIVFELPGGGRRAVTKGALEPVLAACATATLSTGAVVPIASVVDAVRGRAAAFGADGRRVIAIAVRDDAPAPFRREDETGLTLVGLVALHDPLKPGVVEVVEGLRAQGVALKVITGDNRWVAAAIAAKIGLGARVVTGPELDAMTPQAFGAVLASVDVYAEVEPHHKDRIITMLRRAGHVVGFVGDGINDATALHVADVGVSVDSAVDVAKDAADIVLLERDLGVLADGVAEGRRTFANTMKYVFMATSANFGNMFSMAGASLLLPFLPLLPTQILLMNLLTDLPEMTIAGDRVDAELVARPQRWDVRALRRFMIVFGLLSSIFDYATFAALRLGMHAGAAEFRSGWFVESVASAATIVLVIRTRGPAWRSRPSRALAWTTALVVAIAFALPLVPGAHALGFSRLGPDFYALVAGLVLAYVAAAELVKSRFYRVPAAAAAGRVGP
jgi:Mg2+-importing ATPase